MDIKQIRKFLSRFLTSAIGAIITYGFILLFAMFSAPWIYVSLVSSDLINNTPLLYNTITYAGPNGLVIPLFFLFFLRLLQEVLDLVGINNKFTGSIDSLIDSLLVIIQIFYISLLAFWLLS
tara:strand:+ start:211 stop:576 length:366 start_codon:yes stop_codon:yes gene_type:complete